MRGPVIDSANKDHALLLYEKGGDIERDINDNSRSELAMAKGKTTKANTKLMEK